MLITVSPTEDEENDDGEDGLGDLGSGKLEPFNVVVRMTTARGAMIVIGCRVVRKGWRLQG